MTSFTEKFSVGKRDVEIVVNNKLSATLNRAAIEVCRSAAKDFPFTLIPHLRINILGKFPLKFKFFAYIAKLNKRYETLGFVSEEEIKANGVAILNLNLDVA